MTCTLTKDKITKDFVDKNILNPGNLKIRDKYAFKDLNEAYAEYFNDKYEIPGNQKPFNTEGLKAVPNDPYLSQLDSKIYPQIEQNERFERDVEALRNDVDQINKESFKNTSASHRVEKRFRDIMSKMDPVVNHYTSTQEDTIQTTEAKIERMQEVFDAAVLIDRGIEGSAVLLNANHALTKAMEKPVILINPDLLFDDTVFHEFGHLYIDLLGGKSDPVVAEAMKTLRDTELWEEVEDSYPELTEEQLEKEVLATALGFEGNRLFKKDAVKRSAWQALKHRILTAIQNIFNVSGSESALEKLASEMLQNKVRLKPGVKFNSIIDQFKKHKLKKPTQAQIKEYLDQLTAKYNLDDETHEYSDDEGNVFNYSSSKIAKDMTPKNRRANRKGDFDIEYSELYELKESTLKIVLSHDLIPKALDDAMQGFFRGQYGDGLIEGVTTESWSDYYENLETEDPEAYKKVTQVLIDNIDDINAKAQELATKYKKPAYMGTVIHEYIEAYINEEIDDFPERIKDEKGVLIAKVKEIVDTGKANGSMFFPEQVLFSHTAKIPGTADLIEITKDGKFKIYDFKTTETFRDYDGNIENKRNLYVKSGYMNQLIIYASILESYGFEAHQDFMNIFHIAVDRDAFDMDNPETSDIKIKEVLLQNLSPLDKELSTAYKESHNYIIKRFKSPDELKLFNIETKEVEIVNLVQKIQRGVDDFRKLTKRDGGKFIFERDQLPTEVTQKMYKLQKDVNKHIEKNNAMVLYQYITNIHEALDAVYDDATKVKLELDPGYVQNMNYLIQTSDFIQDVKQYVKDSDKDFSLNDKDREEILDLINNIELVSNNVKKIAADKAQQHAINTLSDHSNFQQGAFMEQFEIEARMDHNLKDKEEIYNYVYEQLREHDSSIKSAERQYWTKKFRDGYTNLRPFEDQLADPGMNKSQFVQGVKNILDKMDYNIRIDMDRSIPEIVKWFDNVNFKTTGDPKKIWGDFIEQAEYTDENGKTVKHEHASVIPEFTSEAREVYIKLGYQIEHLDREITKASRAKNKDKAEKLIEQKNKLSKERYKKVDKLSTELYVHPKFKTLSKDQKEALRFIHKKLNESDSRLIGASHKALVAQPTVVGGAKIYNLPRMRMTSFEAIHDAKGSWKNFKSSIQDMFRPPADEDELNIQNAERANVDQSISNTDVEGNLSYDIPVFYRNQLEDPTLQSFDIPTLLALNEETTISYEHRKLIEADLYMITNALRDKAPNRTDAVESGRLVDKVGDRFGKVLKDDNNLVLSNVQASINNRFYKRAYQGTYSKSRYKLIKAGETLGKVTSTMLLSGNFRSAAMTSIQGSVYRIVEGIAGENFDMTHVVKGTTKTFDDLPGLVADTNSNFPTSKTNLLIRRFGLETQYKALVNKFVQTNFITKNMDQGTLFAVTTLAETIVTANLMYTMMSNIKVMNENGKYINAEGKVVPKKEGMTLDEAYSVKDGTLVLNEHVVYTERNLNREFNHPTEGEKTTAGYEVSNFIRSVYADLYGQYNQDLKSKIEMTIMGKLLASMKKWFMRGAHRRFRGVSSAWSMTFKELRDPENYDRRFYSQDQRKFQEGYYVTLVRYLYSLKEELRSKAFSLATLKTSGKAVYSTMTFHERANLVRTASEAVVIGVSMALSMIAMMIINAMDDEDEEKNTDYIYFLAYLAERLKMESITFIWPPELMNLITNPAASISTIQRISDLLENLVMFTVDENNESDWNINNRYERGPRKGDLKIFKTTEHFVPALTDIRQIIGIFGGEGGSSIEDAYKYLTRF
jgi:hypothetical protein